MTVTTQREQCWHIVTDGSNKARGLSLLFWPVLFEWTQPRSIKEWPFPCLSSLNQGWGIEKPGSEHVVDPLIRGRYHGGRRQSSDDSFHSPTVIPPSALDKPSIMKRYHSRRKCRHTSPLRSPTMATLHDTRFVECRWRNGGWTVKTVVTWQSSASMVPAPDLRSAHTVCNCQALARQRGRNLRKAGTITDVSIHFHSSIAAWVHLLFVRGSAYFPRNWWNACLYRSLGRTVVTSSVSCCLLPMLWWKIDERAYLYKAFETNVKRAWVSHYCESE